MVELEQEAKGGDGMNIRDLIQQKQNIQDQITELKATIEPKMKPLHEALNKLETEITDQATAILNAAKDKDTGTFNLNQDGVKIKAVISKTVKWNQDLLTGIWERIAGSGDDPKQYITPEYKISENAYKGWPDAIKGVFLPARTVIPAKPKFEFTIDETAPF
jgi:hypothetical protein